MNEETVPTFEPGSWLDLMSTCASAQERLLRGVLDLKYELERHTGHNVIRSVSGRLKSPESTRQKLLRLHLPISAASASANLHDIVGVRIICSYLQDIGTVLDALKGASFLKVVEIRDYITKAKPSGYRSLHVIAALRIDQQIVLCEIQLRTTAMDAWAALEHQMRYKKDLSFSSIVNDELSECARLLFETDCRMQRIYSSLQQESSIPDSLEPEKQTDDQSDGIRYNSLR